MKLYINPFSPNARRARLVAFYVEAPVEEVLVDFKKGEHKTPEYMTMNPNGAVPTFVDGDLVLTESRVIAQYLAELKPESGLLPSATRDRCQVTRWQFWDASHFSPAVNGVVFEKMIKPAFYGQPTDEARVKEGLANFQRYGAVLNQQLEGKRFVTGDRITLADLTIAATLTHAAGGGVPVADFPNVERWFSEMQALDAWKRSMPS